MENELRLDNALLGRPRLHEIDASPRSSQTLHRGAYLQDTWKQPAMTEFGVRFLVYAWYSTRRRRYRADVRPARVPRFDEPAAARRARTSRSTRDRADLATSRRELVSAGAPVIGTNAWSAAASPTIEGFRDSQGIAPEPRLDGRGPSGDGKTALHAARVVSNPHVNANGLDAMDRTPAQKRRASIRDNGTLLAAGGKERLEPPRPVFGVSGTPKREGYKKSIGVQREMGWGTVVDVTYAGSRCGTTR